MVVEPPVDFLPNDGELRPFGDGLLGDADDREPQAPMHSHRRFDPLVLPDTCSDNRPRGSLVLPPTPAGPTSVAKPMSHPDSTPTVSISWEPQQGRSSGGSGPGSSGTDNTVASPGTNGGTCRAPDQAL